MSVSWVFAFLRFLMWDVDLFDIVYYVEVLVYLCVIVVLLCLDLFVVKGDFNLLCMCL